MSYEKYIVIERTAIEELYQRSNEKLDEYNDSPQSPEYIEHLTIKRLCEWILENEVNQKPFQFNLV